MAANTEPDPDPVVVDEPRRSIEKRPSVMAMDDHVGVSSSVFESLPDEIIQQYGLLTHVDDDSFNPMTCLARGHM
jgi:hypothetical protein